MATKTVTAPHVIFSGTEDEGVAIEPTSHLAFWEGEGTGDVVVASAVQALAGNVGYADGTMPADPGGSFSSLTDPHGVAVSASIINGKPVGFLVDYYLQWVARVDLTGFAALQQGDAGATVTQAQMAGFVTYLDSTTAE